MTFRSLRIGPALFHLALAIAAGCGGPESGRPAPFEHQDTTPKDPCIADDDYEITIIDDGMDRWDFEGGSVPFFRGNDGNGNPDPAGEVSSFPAEAIPGGRCGESLRAVHYTQRNICQWASLSGTLPRITDASDWEGISLWIRAEPNPIAETVGRGIKVGVGDSFTTEITTLGSMETVGGECSVGRVDPITVAHCPPSPPCPTPAEVVDPETGESHPERMCCDRFGLSIGMTDQWRFVAIPFAAMKQGGYGRVADALNLEELIRIEFSLGPGDWDFWLDDVGLYRRRTPNGGEGGAPSGNGGAGAAPAAGGVSGATD